MNNVLKIKDKVTGKWIDIPAIKGGDGKSAYEQAVEGGFQGTEEEFINLLGSLEGVEFTHLIDKNNPHEVTAEQVGALPVEGGTLSGNINVYAGEEAQTRVGEDYNNSGALIYTYNNHTDLQNRTGGITTTLSLVNESKVDLKELLKLWVNDGNSYQIYGTHNKPTADDVGAMSKTIFIDGKDILGIVDDGWYYSINSKNIPTETTYGYVRVMTAPNDEARFRVVYWRPANSSIEYVNVLDGGNWLGWTETFTNKGGTLTGSLYYKNSHCGLAGDGNYIGFNAGDDGNNLRAIHLRRPSADTNKETALIFANVINGVGTNYKIFGEHNKPTQTYNGGGTSQTIAIGGVGNLALVFSTTAAYCGIVTPTGTVYWDRSGAIADNGATYENGVLHLNTSCRLNINGSNYTVYVI